MIIENEFSVAAEIDAVWRHLLDMDGVASCLPGATIQSTDRENVYDGSMRLKIGPMRVEYRGTATLSEIDERNHTAVISLSAREAKGQGSAMATIRNQLEPTGAGTRVRAHTELQIRGPQAQFGRGVIEDVGKRVIGEFAQRLEQRISGSEAETIATQSSPATPPSTSPASSLSSEAPNPPGAPHAGPAAGPAAGPVLDGRAPDELDVGLLLSRSGAVRIAGAVFAGLALAILLLRRRR